MKNLFFILIAFILVGCGSLEFRITTLNNTRPINSQEVQSQINLKTYSTTHQVFSNLDPWDLGLSFGGNWVHCRLHGFHDLNDWSDFRFSPYFCRPSHGFLSGSQWNSNWGGMNRWNYMGRPNYWSGSPHRWSPFGYDRWGYNNWMGNVYYGNYNWYRGVNYFPGQNNWYRGRNVYNGRRATNRSGRWESTTPVRRVNTTPRTRTNTRPTRTTPNTRPIRSNPTRIEPPRRPNNPPTRIEPVRRPNNPPARINPPRNTRTRSIQPTPSRTSGSTTVPVRRRQQ